ncbi:sterile alpha motif domain-containing protein 9-like [Oreochromis aureus]|uniref:SAM domain-containing protein n=1 Tax=Oreochromis aureus TaxID=47969 RepID=A0A668SGU1_OREAU|nr:sterile alpha motif domain-containing protein 9-like [Oreochromis aureus]XP_039466679.1 sterile alpha motif domain-containing protein 9-like [Oreochromis aureus]XP_039466680.1 sterile alpha motif domain-containing protein 9-like [Oreochromis aureus]XP_039466681.1 sterile alpha motif domain-containing protein 9-like [Oreochromis aureus]XP_039466682.1 sterile alpha motif domain-containing protein 9-like [Oreochromis aureus]
MEWCELPYNSWTESHVSSWLKSIGIKEMYRVKILEEEVTGPVLKIVDRDFLNKTIGMKSGQIKLLLKKRDELLIPEEQKIKNKSDLPRKCRDGKKEADTDVGQESKISSQELCDGAEDKNIPTESNDNISTTEVIFCDYRKFDQDEKDFRYVKHHVLPPETGTENMMVPCHEYKSLEIAHTLDSDRLRVKVASEVLRFACACMNMRANGTIHFGIMDKVTGTHKHGEIIGIPVNNREDFIEALNYIERCFEESQHKVDARSCIRHPRFIEVLDKESSGNTWVIEYDIVPKASIVKDKLYSVCVPKFSEKEGKGKCEKEKIPYHRVGAKTPRVLKDDLVRFIQGLREKDQQREEAESTSNETPLEFEEDQKRKLSILLTCGRKYMDNSLFYIVVTNKFQPAHLDSISFLVHMNLFCVFDFDPDSKTSGLCGKYKKQKPAINTHFFDDYAKDKRIATDDIEKSLQLFERISWIFCNGINNFPGGEQPCDEKTWLKDRKKKLKKVVSLICNDILPKRSFVVLFLLMSDVEQPIVETFHEFYSEMTGHEFLAVISESKENYKKWSSLAQVSSPISDLKEISIVEMPLSHVDATVQSIQLLKNQSTRTLPVLNGGVCFLKSDEESMLDSLEIIGVDQCDDTKLEIMSEEKIKQTESYFYRGGKINWINFWLADKHKCGVIIERDAYKEANTLLDKIAHCPKAKCPIESVNIYHHPGSGGSTVARQILWRWRNKVRCAVVKQGKELTTVCEHAVKLREHNETDKSKCLPVLLLLEDHNPHYINNIKVHLQNVIATKKISPSVLCFILLICNRSNDPEYICRKSSSKTVAVTHKLSIEEKLLFSKKLEQLKLQFEPDFILTFVLMTEGFERSYIKDFVKNLLDKIDHSSSTTRLIRFVALLNCYVKDSYMSVSHCEASLGIATYMDRTQYHAFVDHLSDEARLIFIHLKESSTHIQSIRIIHPLVAEEILSHLSANLPQNDIAKDLVSDKVLINHRFGRDEFLRFVRALFIRRNKKSRGDPKDTSFSPLIEHVCSVDEEGVQKAVELMKAAYIDLGEDAFVAQQLARLLYTNLGFEEALEWAEKAKSLLPYNTFILDTVGQVYKRWFYHMRDTPEEKQPSPERCTEIIHTALRGISAFRASEKTPKKETVNLSSYYGEVDVGCSLLEFLSGLDVFSNATGKLMDYLLTDYIPAEVKRPWQKFHQQLKGLQRSLSQALECISEELSYFQTDINEEDEELDARDPEQVHKPREWLTDKSAVYAGFFCLTPDESGQATEINEIDMAGPLVKLSPFQRQMKTYSLGGGNITSILSLLYDKNPKDAGKKLEDIFSLYPENLTWKDLDPTELTNFIFCQIALNCILPGSSKLMSLKKLQELSKRFVTKRKNMSSANALFLLFLLFWPETSDEVSHNDTEILLSAIDALQKLYEQKIQHRSERKSKIITHFFLGKARGLNKIVHRSTLGNAKWRTGEIWKTEKVVNLLKRVEGWTENENLFVKCGSSGKIRVIPVYSHSLPHGNEKVNFYLGFSFDGVVACNIEVMD